MGPNEIRSTRSVTKHLPMLSSSMSCCKRKQLGKREEGKPARGHTQYALHPAMHINPRIENGKIWQRHCMCKSCHMDHVVNEATA
eukprot:14273010-Ditylum_brightwellii.AAC.1